MANNHPQTPMNMPEEDKIKVTPAPAKPSPQPDKTAPWVNPESKS